MSSCGATQPINSLPLTWVHFRKFRFSATQAKHGDSKNFQDTMLVLIYTQLSKLLASWQRDF